MSKQPHFPRTRSRTFGNKTLVKRILVVCEGKKTEVKYLTTLNRLDDFERVNINISNVHGEPHRLIDAALAEVGNYDQIWCMFDVEAPNPHPGIIGVLKLAEENGICLAVSNPCFELWLILHDTDQTGYLKTEQAERLAQAIPEVNGKDITNPNKLVLRRGEAIRRAQMLRKHHQRNHTAGLETNPSTDVDLFIGSLTTS